jgi:hypothetical protein
MQGLAFWIGHRHSLYRHYPLSEGALVAEACNLIFANYDPGDTLLCEVAYSRLMPNGAAPRARADLVIASNLPQNFDTTKDNLFGRWVTVIELKRASAPRNQIDFDLKRLAELRLANNMARTFLFLIAEARRPKRFVAPEGKAILGKHPIEGIQAHYRVRRACKAALAFSGKETAHYACIIEVFAG